MDARIRYTKKVIKESFLGLLKERNLSKITVKAICEKAEINRATFYKYYENPYHLLESLENELLDQLLEKIDKSEAETLQDIFRIILTDIKDKFEMYRTIFMESGDSNFRRKLFAACYKDNIEVINNLFPNMPKDMQVWLFRFIADGCCGILAKWLETGMVRPIDDVLAFADKLITDINKTLPAYFPA